ncbi:hypothetical protein CSOJ01_10095 [Colletotrichum sojae]|uniref:Integral membrane protein n=1 Tax=Colletotrichum sojae TaxID=2175907 RepID=A0A8H6J1Z8_9PEZI|nr:hypothetical protein CSOJ01_10095 [Colletotrichum sojae]
MNIRNANVLFVIACSLVYLYLHFSCYADPSSYFFDPDRAYTPKFSHVRVQEALGFLESTRPAQSSATPNEEIESLSKASTGSTRDTPKLCIGIPTWGQRTQQYLPQTLASLVDTLSPEERNSIHIKVFIVDGVPVQHPSYKAPWLRRLADEVLVYDGLHNRTRASASPADEQTPTNFPSGLTKQQKSAFDFAQLAAACYESRAPFFALIEDDVITSRNWYDRLIKGATTLEEKYRQGSRDWLYLRLFYSETFLGWNNEEWPTYWRWIFASYVVIASVLVLGPRAAAYIRPQPLLRPANTTRQLYFSVLGLWMPLIILLYFLAGRLLMQPMRHGLQPMPSYGCCSQGLVFPRRRLERLSQHFLHPPEDKLFPDQIIERWADDEGLLKWALVPSVLQHIGRMSSSTGGGMRKATWNFRFEAEGRK